MSDPTLLPKEGLVAKANNVVDAYSAYMTEHGYRPVSGFERDFLLSMVAWLIETRQVNPS